MGELKTDVLYYGDNLEILRKHIPDNSIDLIYLDPPFSSKRDYNIIFKEPMGKGPEAQIKAFEDTWHWDRSAEDTYQDIILNGPPKVGKLISAMCDGIGRNDVMAYLVMMTIRLIELRRVLKDSGSLYLHCDPTASHYLKLVLDQVFGAANFQNEIIWHYTVGGKSKKRFARKHDVILFYTKAQDYTFNGKAVGVPRKTGVHSFGGKIGVDEHGRPYQDKRTKEGKYYRYYLDEGKIPEDVWLIESIQSQAKERLSWPTQKPESLLERIILASSNEGDVVLDPFCGCGTALVAAQKLNRRWIGIDITHLAINVMKKRLWDSFGLKAGIDYQVIGEPKDFASACALAQSEPNGRYQFQWWALSLIGAKPLGEKKKGADKGIDGVIDFIDEHGGKAKRTVVQVKSGHTHVKDIRELRSIAEQNDMGIFITLASPTKDMQTEAVSAGYYHSALYGKDFPKIQILTIEELLQGKKVDMPPTSIEFMPRAPKLSKEEGEQIALEDA